MPTVLTVSPLQSPQIKYFARGYQWCPRGAVLRCLVEDDENGQLVVGIDDKELSLKEFGAEFGDHFGLQRNLNCAGGGAPEPDVPLCA